MSKFEINGVELEFDIYDADTYDAYEKSVEEVKKISEKANNTETQKHFSTYIREFSSAVKKHYDEIFGDGTGEKVCSEKDSLVIASKAFTALAREVARQGEALKANSLLTDISG